MSFKRVFVVTASLLAVTLGGLTLFADDVRALFGLSADALGGDHQVARRTSARLEKKSLSGFGGDEGSAPQPATPAPNPVVRTAEDAQSTFAIDVDTASYTFARRSVLQANRRPSSSTVRVEEWVNAFHYSYAEPRGDEPFAISVDGARSPFDERKTLLRVGLQGRELSAADRKPAHLVFLVDVSGSMSGDDRLPLARQALSVLVTHLRADDTVALVTYAGSTQVVLPPTKATQTREILSALEQLRPGGGTAMGSGMELAYRLAVQQVSARSTTRVIVLTDGDANIGANVTPEQILASVHHAVAEGVTLTTVGFGMGNYRGEALERLADMGDGQALYIDSPRAIRKAFVDGLTGTLEVIAKDTKVQVTFDPRVVKSYRLVGYENRDVADADFTNDRVDAGELGAGHQVTALYELELTGEAGAVGTVAVRGARPDGTIFQANQTITRRQLAHQLEELNDDFRFATAVALGADTVRGNVIGRWPLSSIAALARGSARGDEDREEFVRILDRLVTLEARSYASSY